MARKKSKLPSSKRELVAMIVPVFIVLVFGVPLLINEAYKANAGYVTLWGAADVLSYYAAILGSAITIGGLVATIHYGKRDTEQQIKALSAPFFVVETAQSLRQGQIAKFTNESEGKWQQEFFRSQFYDYAEPVTITLCNIGTGVAISPSYCIDDFSNKHFLAPQYVQSGGTVRLSFEQKNILDARFSAIETSEPASGFTVNISLNYKNEMGMDFTQIISLRYLWRPTTNSILLYIDGISHKTSPLLGISP